MPQSTESTDSQSAPQTAYLPTNPQAGVAAIVDESVHPGKFDDHKGSSSGVDNSIKLASSSFEADIRSKRKESFWNIYRSTTFQFFIVGCLAFAGPAQVSLYPPSESQAVRLSCPHFEQSDAM